MLRKSLVLSSIAVLGFAFTTAVPAEGDKNSHNNPSGTPSSGSFEAPFTNYDGDGRMIIFCAEDELLVAIPEEGGVLTVTCVPDEP